MGGAMSSTQAATPATGGDEPRPPAIANLNSAYFWPIFGIFFLLFLLPAGLVAFLEFSGFDLVQNPTLVDILRFIRAQELPSLVGYFTQVLLPLSAIGTLTNTSSDANFRKGIALVFLYGSLLAVIVVLYFLTWPVEQSLTKIIADSDSANPIKAVDVCREVWKAYIAFITLNLSTLLGISATQKK